MHSALCFSIFERREYFSKHEEYAESLMLSSMINFYDIQITLQVFKLSQSNKAETFFNYILIIYDIISNALN